MEDKELWGQISGVVDKWVSEVLRSRFLEKPQGQKPRSLWDKFKQGVANWWWGPNGDKHNKYKWRNRFGDELGVTESFDPSAFTLHEYMEIRGLVDSVESRLDESEEEFDSLRLMQIVRDAAETLKRMLYDALVGKIDGARPSATTSERPVAGGETPAASTAESPSTGAEGGGVPPVKRVEDPRKAVSKAGPPSAAETGAGDAEETARLKAAGRKSNSQRIKEAADEVAKMNDAQRHALKPEKDWVREGVVRKDRLPHLVTWMAMRTHRDPLNDEHITQELKHALGSEVNLGIPAKAGSLERYLRDELGSDFEKVMSKLGVEADRMGKGAKPAAKDKEPEKKSAPPIASAPSKDKEKTASDSGAGGDEAEGLSAYLYDGAKPKDVESAARLIFDFIEKVSDETNEDKKERLEDWFDSEMEHLENKDKRDAFDHLEGSLLSSDSYLEKMSDILGIDKESLRNKMIDYIRSIKK